MDYNKLWLKFYYQHLDSVSVHTSQQLEKAREFADKCVKSLKEANND